MALEVLLGILGTFFRLLGADVGVAGIVLETGKRLAIADAYQEDGSVSVRSSNRRCAIADPFRAGRRF